MIKFVNKKASNINNNAPLAQNLNSDNKEDVNETQAENLQKGEEDFKVIEKKKHEHVVAEKGKEKEGRFKIMKGKNEKENKTQKEQHPKKEKPVENNEPINNEPILEKKEEISKIVHFTVFYFFVNLINIFFIGFGFNLGLIIDNLYKKKKNIFFYFN